MLVADLKVYEILGRSQGNSQATERSSQATNPAHATQNIDRQTPQTKHGSSHPDSRMKHQAVKDCYERGRKKNRKKYHLNVNYKQLGWWQLMQIRTLGFHESRSENPKNVKIIFHIWVCLNSFENGIAW